MYTCRKIAFSLAPGFHMYHMLPFFSPSGAEGSQGAQFCREEKWKQAEVNEQETCKQTLAESSTSSGDRSQEGLAQAADSTDLPIRHKSHKTKLSQIVEGVKLRHLD